MKLDKPKYIFVTGGVASSLGKGIISASVARLLQARGYSVTVQKFDPYLNVDPGTLTVLIRVECSRVHIQIRVELLHCNRITTCLQKTCY